jgi:hypothetical protein
MLSVGIQRLCAQQALDVQQNYYRFPGLADPHDASQVD